MQITTRAACDAFGCFVEGLDVSRASPDDIRRCRELLFEHGAIFMRGQSLDPQAQIAFAEAVGDIVVNRFFTPVPGFPKAAQLITEPDQGWIIGEKWHTDHSYDAAPALGSILYAVEVPPTGGDTCFAGVQAAYDALAPAMKDRLEGLTARHDSAHVFAPSEEIRLSHATGRGDADYVQRAASYPSAVHPVVLAHPETGRKCLFVNPIFTTGINGLSRIESDAVLKMLYEHCAMPDYQVRFRWRPNSVAFWDNRCVQHVAIWDYFPQVRSGFRVTVKGERPV